MYRNFFKAIVILITLVQIAIVHARDLPDFTELVNNNAAAVVNISTSIKKSETGNMPHGFNMPDVPEDSPFHDFFKKYFEELPKGFAPPSQERSSLGSGFIISNDGYVITNNHVVSEAEEIVVRLNDRREFIAELIGTDKRSDIAVLKIDAVNLPTLKLGNSSNLNVGEWVLAIGSPFGFDHSVTAGIISAIGRSLPNENYVPFIQTDVAINPGNSGGPLFNLDGEVIGVNSQIYSRTGGFMGLSFAVPVDVVENVYKQLRENGRVARGWLGVLIQDVTRELAESFGMEHPHGALIAKVLPDGPAEKSGLEVGDIVVKFNGEKVSFSSDLPPLVGSTPVDSLVPVDIIRRSKNKTIQVKISELPTDDEVIASNKNAKPDADTNSLNVIIKNLTKEQKEDIEEYGVFVQEIHPGPAQKAGIRRGDIILLINNIKIKGVSHFNMLINDLPKGRSIPVLIQRQGGPIFLALKIDD
ncbi:MAG: Do family serine endopeptidase [Proteobacteria bacterium]|nr:Do family serine endopeptidase [Pseudomonadota bacterium]NOG59369.1 Do family serine endopeptidase [Pseudomonadota bacterium]